MKKKKMPKYYRYNPYLGCKYEISEKQALRLLSNIWWVPVWDDYWQCPSMNSWYNLKDPERDWIFKEE